jgi:hypothetical protein
VAGRSDLWRWTPLLSAITIYAAAALTFGIGFVLFPIALALSLLLTGEPFAHAASSSGSGASPAPRSRSRASACSRSQLETSQDTALEALHHGSVAALDDVEDRIARVEVEASRSEEGGTDIAGPE